MVHCLIYITTDLSGTMTMTRCCVTRMVSFYGFKDRLQCCSSTHITLDDFQLI